MTSQFDKRWAAADFLLFPGSLGDFLLFLPTALALANQGRQVVLAARGSWLVLVRHPSIHTVSIDDRAIIQLYCENAFSSGMLRPEWASGIERAFSWSGHGLSGFAERLKELTRARHVAQFPFRGMEAGEHAVDYYARCVGVRPARLAPSDIDCDPATARTASALMDASATPWLVIHAGSGSPLKNWRGFPTIVQRWREEQGGRVAEIRGPAEREWLPPLPSVAQRIATPDLRELAAWLRAAPLYIGNDSGVSHLAGGLSQRSVVLFGPTDPRTWAPRGGNVHLIHRPEPCSACGPHTFCTHRLSVDEVWAVLLAALREPADHSAGSPHR